MLIRAKHLHWHLISTYRNEDSKAGSYEYMAGFALLLTVDHVAAEATKANFRICAWRTNAAKNNLSLEALLEVCVKVLQYAGYSVQKPD